MRPPGPPPAPRYRLSVRGGGAKRGTAGTANGAAGLSIGARQAAPALLITAAAAFLYLWRLTSPHTMIFDENFYVPDACLYLHGPGAPCGIGSEASWLHPPLAKWILAGAIRLFGYHPFGWRIAPAAAGIASVFLVYAIGLRLLASTFSSSVAALLFATDFLVFVQARVAMLDIFALCFGLTCILLTLLAAGSTRGKAWLRLGAGVAGGAAVASKWSGVLLLVVALVIAAGEEVSRHRESSTRHPAAVALGALAFGYVLVPVAVYCLSYTGRVGGALLSPPWGAGSWVRNFLHLQKSMLTNNLGFAGLHPYESPAWSWPLLKRPVLYFISGDGRRRILALGNPLLWWPGLAAIVHMVWRLVSRRGSIRCEGVIVLGLAAVYGPWLVLTRVRSFVFLYYFLPAVPFLCLAVARSLQSLGMRGARAAAAAYLAVTVAAFGYYYPVLTGRPLSPGQMSQRLLFEDCGRWNPVRALHAAEGNSSPPRSRPPPHGWCWQ